MEPPPRVPGGLRISFGASAGYSFHSLPAAQPKVSDLPKAYDSAERHPKSHGKGTMPRRPQLTSFSFGAGSALRGGRLQLSQDEKHWRQSDQVAMVLNQLIGSKRKVYGKLMRDAEHVFSILDTDGSGKLDYEEFRVALKRMGLGLSPNQVGQLIEVMDRDRDGFIDRLEFTAGLDAARANHRAQGKASLTQAQLHMRAQFRRSSPSAEPWRQQQARRALTSHSSSAYRANVAKDDEPEAQSAREAEIVRIAQERCLTKRYLRDQYMRSVALKYASTRHVHCQADRQICAATASCHAVTVLWRLPVCRASAEQVQAELGGWHSQPTSPAASLVGRQILLAEAPLADNHATKNSMRSPSVVSHTPNVFSSQTPSDEPDVTQPTQPTEDGLAGAAGTQPVQCPSDSALVRVFVLARLTQ